MKIYDLLALQTGFPFDIITNSVKWLLCSSSTRTPLFCFLMSFLFAAGNVSLSIAGHGSSNWCGSGGPVVDGRPVTAHAEDETMTYVIPTQPSLKLNGIETLRVSIPLPNRLTLSSSAALLFRRRPQRQCRPLPRRKRQLRLR